MTFLTLSGFRVSYGVENGEVEEVKDNTKDGQKAAAVPDSVTDHVEEKEMAASTASMLFYFGGKILKGNFQILKVC